MMYRIVLAVMVAAAALSGCGGNESGSTPQPGQYPQVVVRTAPVELRDFPVTVRLGGTLRGDRQTMIPAKVTTTVTNIPARAGQRVAKGDRLVALDPGGVQSQYRQAEALLRNAEKQWTKMRSLYEAGAVSETQLDAAEMQYDVARADFNSARQAIEIEAPFDGIVTDVYVRIGDEVAPGMPLVEVADIASLRLYLEVPTAQIGKLKTGQTVRVASPIDSAVVMTGTVASIADAADQVTRSFEVECHFPAPPGGFAPGVYVIAEIETEILKSALVVPNEAILYRSGKAMLYAILDDTAMLLTVAERATGQGETAVNGDVAPGQRVVVVGQKNLTPGAHVREAD